MVGGEEDGEGEEEEGGEGGGGGWKNKAKLGKSTSSYLQFCDSYAQNASKGIAQREESVDIGVIAKKIFTFFICFYYSFVAIK